MLQAPANQQLRQRTFVLAGDCLDLGVPQAEGSHQWRICLDHNAMLLAERSNVVVLNGWTST